MANSTSANLKLTVQATGENSGTWGQITNTNLLILEQAIGGFTTFNLTNANRSLTFTVTGIALSASLGDETTVGEINTGWGRLNWGEDRVVVAPTPDQTYTIQLNYILKPAGLSSTVPTTYLSLQFPNGLLYACLVEAYGFLKGPNDLLQLYEGRYKQAVEGFSIEQMGRRRRDEYQSGVPRIGK